MIEMWPDVNISIPEYWKDVIGCIRKQVKKNFNFDFLDSLEYWIDDNDHLTENQKIALVNICEGFGIKNTTTTTTTEYTVKKKEYGETDVHIDFFNKICEKRDNAVTEAFFRAFAMLYHPDRNGNNGETMKRLNVIYGCYRQTGGHT